MVTGRIVHKKCSCLRRREWHHTTVPSKAYDTLFADTRPDFRSATEDILAADCEQLDMQQHSSQDKKTSVQHTINCCMESGCNGWKSQCRIFSLRNLSLRSTKNSSSWIHHIWWCCGQKQFNFGSRRSGKCQRTGDICEYTSHTDQESVASPSTNSAATSFVEISPVPLGKRLKSVGC